MSDLDDVLKEVREMTEQLDDDADLTGGDSPDDRLFRMAQQVLEGGDLSPGTIDVLLAALRPVEHLPSSAEERAAARRRITSRPRRVGSNPLEAMSRRREDRGLSLDNAAALIGTSAGILEEIEGGNYRRLLALSPELVAGYLRELNFLSPEALESVFAESNDVADDNAVSDERQREWILAFVGAHRTAPQASSNSPTWTNASVLRLAKGRDPVQTMLELAQSATLGALDSGWTGPPFDPIRLGQIMGIEIVASDDVRDARTVPTERGLRIEFNPNRPRPRVRYSIAHEIGHTLFPDCRARVRNRATYHELRGDEYQIEALCNLAAAEFLMPIGSFKNAQRQALSIDVALGVREQFQVSMEAALIRMIRSTDLPGAMFAASAAEPEGTSYRLDYAIGSSDWRGNLPVGYIFPARSVIADCRVVGFTAKGDERWGGRMGVLHVECVAVAPYPSRRVPRVIGIAQRINVVGTAPPMTYLRGDATDPRGSGPKLIVQIVNDATANWGGAGFAQFVRRKWPHVQADFREWTHSHPAQFSLGNIHVTAIEEELWIADMVAQHGYGPATKPRLRYEPLRSCLSKAAEFAVARGASIHMPRIGTGQAGGSWPVIRDLVMSQICERGIAVTVYDPVGADVDRAADVADSPET